MAEDSSLLGRKALITGACEGSLGREIIYALIKCGIKVIAADTSNTKLESLKLEVPNIETAHLDITKFSSIFEVVETIGPVDFLLNKGQNSEETPSQVTENVKGLVEVSEIIVRHLIARKVPGVIINLCTDYSYKETKNLTRIASLELENHKIRVNCINCSLLNRSESEDEESEWLDENADPSKKKFENNQQIIRAILYLLNEKDSLTGICLPQDAQMLNI